MSVPTFKECKNILEEFYKQRKHFFISEIEINQVEPVISAYSYVSNIHFTTDIKFKEDKFLIADLYKNLKPIIAFASSYTKSRKFINHHPNLILTEDNPILIYDYVYIDQEIYVKDLKVVLKTHYDFYDSYDADYDLYFSVLAELENNNELIVSHDEPTPEKPKVINLFKIFKSDDCIICMDDKPNILFCNCGHLCICEECYNKKILLTCTVCQIKTLYTCPVCKMDNEIIRMLE